MDNVKDEIAGLRKLIEDSIGAVNKKEIGLYVISSNKRQKGNNKYLSCGAREIHMTDKLIDAFMSLLSSFREETLGQTKLVRYTEVDSPSEEEVEFLRKSEVAYATEIEKSLRQSTMFANNSYLDKAENLGYAIKFSEDLIGIGRIYRKKVYIKRTNYIMTRFVDSETKFDEVDGMTYFEFSGYFPALIVSNYILIKDESDFEALFMYNEKLNEHLSNHKGELGALIDEPDGFLQRVGGNRRALKSLAIGLEKVDLGKITPEYINRKTQDYNLDIHLDEQGKIIGEKSNLWDVVELLTDRLYQGEITKERYKVMSRKAVHI